MKNLPIHGVAEFRRNKKRTAKMTVRCTSHFGFGNGKTNRHGAQRI